MGALVIFIVATAGMVSTTYVQFIKGFLLLIAAFMLTIGVLWKAGLGPVDFISSIIDNPALVTPNWGPCQGSSWRLQEPSPMISGRSTWATR